MHFSPIDLIMPHYCCSCGAVGEILCDYCKYNIVNECVVECIACARPVARYGDTCKVCSPPYARAWAAARHRDSIRALIGYYKFDGARAAGSTLGMLLHEALPELPSDVIVTSIPTAPPHIRERGYDHAALIAKQLARQRSLHYTPTMRRLHTMKQRGANKRERLAQAATAFAPIQALSGGRYLVVDDVCTTGATVFHAARVLRNAGAKEVWVAVISKEPLD